MVPGKEVIVSLLQSTIAEDIIGLKQAARSHIESY